VISADRTRVPLGIPIVETHISPISVSARSNSTGLSFRKLLTDVPVQQRSEEKRIVNCEKNSMSSDSTVNTSYSMQTKPQNSTNTECVIHVEKEYVVDTHASAKSSSDDGDHVKSKSVEDFSNDMKTKCDSYTDGHLKSTPKTVRDKPEINTTQESNVKQTEIVRETGDKVNVKIEANDIIKEGKRPIFDTFLPLLRSRAFAFCHKHFKI
jgi:hypothetical protein